ncbi:hypothetical protein ACFW04_014479 [Cataglyphis niger]
MHASISHPSTPSSSRNTVSTMTHVRLPKLNLSIFSGKYDEWFPFFDTFNTIIHFNISLNNIQRFQYLRASLAGDASNTLLKERYENKRIIVQNHVKAIMELASMTKENYFELRQIADGTMKHLHVLQPLKRSTAHWDDLLIHILSSKIDSLTLREWQSSLTGSELPTLKQFIDFIQHRCQMLEAMSNVKRHASCTAIVKSKCNYCQGRHSIYYWDFLVLPVSQRISEIRNRKICANCLRSSTHSSNKCTFSNCKVCQAKHNMLLLATIVAESSVKSASNDEISKAVDSPPVLATHTSSMKNNNHNILSTAVVHVYDNKGSHKSCRVLLIASHKQI